MLMRLVCFGNISAVQDLDFDEEFTTHVGIAHTLGYSWSAERGQQPPPALRREQRWGCGVDVRLYSIPLPHLFHPRPRPSSSLPPPPLLPIPLNHPPSRVRGCAQWNHHQLQGHQEIPGEPLTLYHRMSVTACDPQDKSWPPLCCSVPTGGAWLCLWVRYWYRGDSKAHEVPLRHPGDYTTPSSSWTCPLSHHWWTVFVTALLPSLHTHTHTPTHPHTHPHTPTHTPTHTHTHIYVHTLPPCPSHAHTHTHLPPWCRLLMMQSPLCRSWWNKLSYSWWIFYVSLPNHSGCDHCACMTTIYLTLTVVQEWD